MMFAVIIAGKEDVVYHSSSGVVYRWPLKGFQ